MSQITQGNANYVYNFSFYCCLRQNCYHMGNALWSTQIKVLFREHLGAWRARKGKMASGQIIRSVKQQSLSCCCSYRNINPSNFDFPQCFIYIFEAFHTAGVTAITMPLGPRLQLGQARVGLVSTLTCSRRFLCLAFYCVPLLIYYCVSPQFLQSIRRLQGGSLTSFTSFSWFEVRFGFVVPSHELADVRLPSSAACL